MSMPYAYKAVKLWYSLIHGEYIEMPSRQRHSLSTKNNPRTQRLTLQILNAGVIPEIIICPL